MEERKEERKERRYNPRRTLLADALVIAAAVCLFGTAMYETGRRFGRDDLVTVDENGTPLTRPDTSSKVFHLPENMQALEFPDKDVDLGRLVSQNSDCIGWLYFPDADVDYPLLKEDVNEINYYINHNFSRQSDVTGALFTGYFQSTDFTDSNTYIYGHNMESGTMFGRLKELYRDPSKMKSPYFYIWTPTERIKYRVLSAYVVNEMDDMYDIPGNEAEYDEYVDKMFEKSVLSGPDLLTDEDKALSERAPLVTLYTCYGGEGTTDRLYIQGVEVVREQR